MLPHSPSPLLFCLSLSDDWWWYPRIVLLLPRASCFTTQQINARFNQWKGSDNFQQTSPLHTQNTLASFYSKKNEQQTFPNLYLLFLHPVSNLFSYCELSHGAHGRKSPPESQPEILKTAVFSFWQSILKFMPKTSWGQSVPPPAPDVWRYLWRKT